jgi:hypothetical protein
MWKNALDRVSMTPHAKDYSAVSMTPHVKLIVQITLRIRIYILNGFNPLKGHSHENVLEIVL